MSSYYQPSSFHDLILHSERQYADLPFFYSWQDKVEDFQPVSYREFISDVRRVADWLIQNGYQNKRIMLFGVNSYQWMVCYVAIATYVGVCIGAAKDWKHYDFARAVDVSQPDSIIADTALLGITSTLADSVRTVEFSELFKKDSALLENSEYYESLARDDEETCVVVFTTGTTAFPKATQLTFKNMLTNGRSLYERSPATSSDRFYMFLPMHHIYSQVCVSLAAFLLGGRLYLAHDLTNVRKELALSQPTMLSGVPLFFERIHIAI